MRISTYAEKPHIDRMRFFCICGYSRNPHGQLFCAHHIFGWCSIVQIIFWFGLILIDFSITIDSWAPKAQPVRMCGTCGCERRQMFVCDAGIHVSRYFFSRVSREPKGNMRARSVECPPPPLFFLERCTKLVYGLWGHHKQINLQTRVFWDGPREAGDGGQTS